MTTPDTFGAVRVALAGMPGLPRLPGDAGSGEPFPLPVAGRWVNPAAVLPDPQPPVGATFLNRLTGWLSEER